MNRPQEIEERPVAVEKKEKKAQKDSALRRFGRDLTDLAAKRALPPLIGRREEMLKITQIRLQSRKNNLILICERGVGKTGIVEGFAQLLAEGKLPDALGKPAVIEISLTSLVAGTRGGGTPHARSGAGRASHSVVVRVHGGTQSVIILTRNLGTGNGWRSGGCGILQKLLGFKRRCVYGTIMPR